jgi:hypothetical protein
VELLRGADLESRSRRHRVTIATLSQWRERFLAGGEATLKSREVEAEDEEIKRLKSVLAGVCVDNELLRREDRATGEQPPFGVLEVEAMSCAVSPCSKKP